MNTDKDKTGVRYDSTPIANGVIKAGAACDLINYNPDGHMGFASKVAPYDGLIVRINPGQLSGPGVKPGAQKAFDDLMMDLVGKGVLVWSSPAVQTQLGAKDALVCIKDLSCGLPDTAAYYTPEDLAKGFKTYAAFQPRVIKQNRGSAGEGIWLVWLKDKNYCKNLGDAVLNDNDKLKLMEMNDNHVEYHTVGEFLEFCVNGPTPKAGAWTSTFPGEYLKGGKDAGGQLVDQRLLPRITEGEVRMQMVKDTLFAIIHKKPTGGGMSAVGGVADYTFYAPDDPKYADLRAKFEGDIPLIMSSMGLENEPLPILWTGDFIPVSGHVAPFVVGEFNCSCVGISKFFPACGPDKDLADVPDGDFAEGSRLTDLIGLKAVETLDEAKSKKRCDALLAAPANPKYKVAVIGFTAPGGAAQNTDKDKTGVRYDSTPIANGVIKAGASCDLINYDPTKHNAFKGKVAPYDGLIVRINPGQLSGPGVKPGAQKAFDDLMMDLVGKGVLVWSSPAVQTQLGAKDALVCIKDLSCGLPDTAAYYTPEDLAKGFKTYAAFQPRVIKQNRGSAGEGIWLVWLKDKNYCKNLGDAVLNDNDKLKLMEMNDNHVEYPHGRRVPRLLCQRSGPGGAAGEWHVDLPRRVPRRAARTPAASSSTSACCRRITEGEVRMQMVKDTLFAIIHKKPTERQACRRSAACADYTFYAPR